MSGGSNGFFLGEGYFTYAENENFEDLLLKHLLASHHGKQEYGAITVPQLPEAIMLNRIDMIDAEMYQCEHAIPLKQYSN